MHRRLFALTLLTALGLSAAPARAIDIADRYELGAQINVIPQAILPFRSPYQGPNSFVPGYDGALSHMYTLFLGARLVPGLEAYLDPEMILGSGVSKGFGLAGYANGDVVRNPSISQGPYLARGFIRAHWALAKETSAVPGGENQVAEMLPTHRLQLTAGKLAVNDIFDTNAYASSSRQQFLNWDLITDAAYDFAADTRGYSEGAALEWINPDWTARAGVFRMPTVANGPELDPNVLEALGDQLELETQPTLLFGQAMDLKLLGYLNHGQMGDYAQAIAQAAPGQAPDITKTRSVGQIKYGAALNWSQPIADDGNTGLFARLGWNDGQTESFVYTEADRAFSLGAQISGARWHRPGDRWGLACAINGLSAAHAQYLAAGGQGFMLGDGKLNYAPETVLESYYAFRVTDWLTLSLDAQYILNPGYNADRGPTPVLGARLHAEI